MNNKMRPGYSLNDFIPLILIFSLIIIATAARSYLSHNWQLQEMMMNFMGTFFIIFGSFKLLKLASFAEAYATYDLIAKRSHLYALAYPFIELGLGILYSIHIQSSIIIFFTLVLMLISAAGVAIELSKGNQIVCACLGTVFKIPMTYVTLAEDLAMALMALVMLIMK
jgi:hypothetical protein